MDAATPASDAGAEGGWTTCTTPGGIRACGGPNQCMCPDNPDYCPEATGDPGLCDFNFGPQGLPTCGPGSEDGLICIGVGTTDQPQYEAYFDTGVLLAQNGASYRVHYADFSAFTGAALPIPTSCPQLGSMSACGGIVGAACGQCADGERCVGRSPTHPVGVCLPTRDAKTACSHGGGMDAPCADAGSACFSFKVDVASQALADYWGVCLPNASCADLQQKLPGGARCL